MEENSRIFEYPVPTWCSNFLRNREEKLQEIMQGSKIDHMYHVEYRTSDGFAVISSKHVIRLICNDFDRVRQAINEINKLIQSLSKVIGTAYPNALYYNIFYFTTEGIKKFEVTKQNDSRDTDMGQKSSIESKIIEVKEVDPN